MFRDNRICFLLIGCLTLLLAPAAPGYAWDAEADLLATLVNDQSSLFDKAIACKQLAVVGTEAAVPVLAGLLDGDEKLSHYARYGLEPNPSPKVDVVLGEKLSELQGRRLIGVIQSIGNRGKAEAIDALAAKLDDADRAVATAAAHSIARLGTAKAAEILSAKMSREFAAACLVCGKTLQKQGRQDLAGSMLVKLAALEGAPQHVLLAAKLQAISLPHGDSPKMLAAALKSDDPDEFNMGLRGAPGETGRCRSSGARHLGGRPANSSGVAGHVIGRPGRSRRSSDGSCGGRVPRRRRANRRPGGVGLVGRGGARAAAGGRRPG